MSTDQAEANVGGINESASLVSGPKRLQLTTGQKLGVAGLVALVFLAFIWIDNSMHKKEADKQPELAVRPTPANFRPAPISLPPPPAPVVQQTRPAPPAPASHEMSPADSPIFAYSGNPTATVTSTATSANTIVPAIMPAAAAGGQSALSNLLKPTVLEGSKASLLPHPDMLITKGTIIACTLQTAINTELAGYAKCVLPEAVRSTTGNVVLLDRGTTIVGEIQSGVSQGQQRVFILWDRAETPDHAVVSLASPGADELGRAGVSGSVDNHFMDRFGSAIMLSILQGALQAGTAAAGGSGGSGGTSITAFQTNGQQIAGTSLQASINIPPTLEKNQGDNVSIFVARDLDFSSVYRLSLAR